jgi:DNA (cytosine-5)-methyltransferase 3A
MAGSKVGMVTSKNVEVTSLEQYLKLKSQNFKFKGQSYLFWEFVRLLKEMKPKYFLLENVKMDKKWEDLITRTLGVAPVRINSALVSAQNRERLYWTNIPNVVPPKDLGVHIRRVIPNAVGGAGIRGRLNKKKGTYDYCTTIRKDGKSNCLVTAWDRTGKVALKNGKIRILTIKEGEKLQTLPKDYTNVPKVSNTSRIEMIGNGWTIDVISHIFKNLKENI